MDSQLESCPSIPAITHGNRRYHYTLTGSALTNNTGLSCVGSGAVTINNDISGSGSLSKSGSGKTTLNEANTYTGGTTLSDGILRFYNAGSLGTGDVNISGGVLQGANNITVTNNITMTGGNIYVNVPRTVTLTGILNMNADGVGVYSSSGNRYLQLAGVVNGTATTMTVGRGWLRIMSAATWNYTGKMNLYRSGPGDSNLEISDGRNLPNDLVMARGLNNPKIIALIAGSTSGEYSGDIDTGPEDADGMFDIKADAGETITVSGIISDDGDGTGVDKTGDGTVILTGTSTYDDRTIVDAGTLLINGDNSGAVGTVTVDATTNDVATLGGNGTVGGVTEIYGAHSPGSDSFGLQTFSGNLNYNTNADVNVSPASVIWQLGANSAANRGTDFDGIDVGGDLDFDSGATLELVFDHAGSTVDWSDPFWGGDRQWLIWDVAGTTTGFNELSLTIIDWADAQGDFFDTVYPEQTFTITQSGNGIYLNYDAPPLGTVISIN